MNVKDIPMETIDSICLSCRHDFRALTDASTDVFRRAAKELANAIKKHGWSRPEPEPPQAAQWVPPAVLQGEEWRGTKIYRSCDPEHLTRVYIEGDLQPAIHLIWNNHKTPIADSMGLSHTYLCQLKPGQSVPLGPQPKPAWKCTGGLARTGVILTHDKSWKLWKYPPCPRQDGIDSVIWRHTQYAIAQEGCGGWNNWLRLIGPLPDVDGVSVQERIWEL